MKHEDPQKGSNWENFKNANPPKKNANPLILRMLFIKFISKNLSLFKYGIPSYTKHSWNTYYLGYNILELFNILEMFMFTASKAVQV